MTVLAAPIQDAPRFAAPLAACEEVAVDRTAAGLRVTARVEVRDGSPYLDGHFPGMPVFPGVFILEALRQALVPALGTGRGYVPDLVELRSVRFLAPLVPGDTLVIVADVDGDPAAETVAVIADCRRADGVRVAAVSVTVGGCSSTPAEAAPEPRAAAAVLEFADISRILPHGHPMILLDRVVELRPGVALRAVKAISGSEPCYGGLGGGLPRDRYAYPASLLVESFGQAAAALWLSGAERPATAGVVPMFAAAYRCVRTGSGYPGDTLCHAVRIEHANSKSAYASGETWAGSRRIASFGSLLAVLRPGP